MKRTLALVALAASVAVGGLVGAREAAGSAAAADDRAQTQGTLTVRATRFGRVLFDGRGRVLYGFTRDRRGAPSRCYGECAKAWPVYFAKDTMRAGTGVKKSLVGTTRRRDGRLQ